MRIMQRKAKNAGKRGEYLHRFDALANCSNNIASEWGKANRFRKRFLSSLLFKCASEASLHGRSESVLVRRVFLWLRSLASQTGFRLLTEADAAAAEKERARGRQSRGIIVLAFEIGSVGVLIAVNLLLPEPRSARNENPFSDAY